jgi:ATPases involved in chromosome partitioning
MISKVSKPEFAVARSSRGNKLSWIIFLSFIVGLVAGFVSVYVSEVLDMKFRSVDEVEELISAPILGILPRFHDELSRLAFEQGIEGIRINVELLSLKKNIAIFCLSSISSEGKSTISFGLGKSFAASGKKVVVLDLNLRHPALSNSLGYESSHGFVDIVTYDLKLEDVLKKIDENFYFIPAGTRHPSPSSFLSHQKVKDFIISLKEKFDYIIVDSSPILAVYDILNLIHLSDFNILVMGTDRISKVHAKRVSTLIRQVRSKIDGVVLNFVDEKVSPYIKYYVYKYGYYYYYYQSGDKNKRDNKKRK